MESKLHDYKFLSYYYDEHKGIWIAFEITIGKKLTD